MVRIGHLRLPESLASRRWLVLIAKFSRVKRGRGERGGEIESTSGRYAAYLAVIRVIPQLSGELLESNRACDRWCATGWREGEDWREWVRREHVPLPSRSSRSSRGASNKRGRQVDDPPRMVRRRLPGREWTAGERAVARGEVEARGRGGSVGSTMND